MAKLLSAKEMAMLRRVKNFLSYCTFATQRKILGLSEKMMESNPKTYGVALPEFKKILGSEKTSEADGQYLSEMLAKHPDFAKQVKQLTATQNSAKTEINVKALVVSYGPNTVLELADGVNQILPYGGEDNNDKAIFNQVDKQEEMVHLNYNLYSDRELSQEEINETISTMSMDDLINALKAFNQDNPAPEAQTREIK
jgi:hypothetical protein